MLHQYSSILDSDGFLPNFYPKRESGGVERLFLLVMAANREGRPEFVTSLRSGHAGSIPVARSTVARSTVARSSSLVFCDFLFLDVRSSSLPGRKPAHTVFSSLIGIFELSYVDVRGWWDYPSFYPECQQP
jgi:hypothetical protein